MATTNNLQITLIEQSQAQKEVTANEAFSRIEALINNCAIERGITTPPASPSEGDLYLIGSGASGLWAGNDNNIAYFNQIWRYITPREGALIYVKSENAVYRYDGSYWLKSGSKQVETLSANHLTTYGDINKLYKVYSGIDITIQNDSSVFFPTGSEIEFVQFDVNPITFVEDAGVTILSEGGALTTISQNQHVKLTKLEGNLWLMK